jgi:predicted nucleic acid-binding protein
VTLTEDDGCWATLRTLMARARLDGPRVHDARVAALCLSHAVRELWTADRDFSLFPALRVRNPLVG